MNYTLANALISIGLFVGMLVLLEAGRRRALAAGGDAEGGGAIEAGVFGLLGLLIAFNFSGAAGRFEDRRQLITEETNAIGTFALRLDLLPAESREALRRDLVRWIDVRLAVHQRRGDLDGEARDWAEIDRLQGSLWAQTVAAVKAEGVPPATMSLVLGALNDVFDQAGKRRAALLNHPPAVTSVMLAALALIASLLAGLGLAKASAQRLRMVVYAAAIAGTFFVTRDLEQPRTGLIRVEDSDVQLMELRGALGK